MNRKYCSILAVILSLAMLMALSACGNRSGGTYDEPEITADYLMGEYAEQLTTDGAETLQGSISLETADDSYNVILEEKQIVASESSEEGYYIADRNIEKTLAFDLQCRIVVLEDGEYAVVEPDEFIANYNDAQDQIYTLYCFGDMAELMIPVDPEESLK